MSETPQTPENKPTIVEEIEYESDPRGGCQGCLYGIGGAVGCLGIVAILFAGLLFFTETTLGNFVDGVSNIFNNETSTRNVSVPVVEGIQQLSALATVRYNYSNIVETSVDMPDLLAGLYGNSQVMIAVGSIDAGINLAEVTEDDLVIDEEANTMMLTLPPPVILNCALDESKSEVIERDTGLFASPLPELDTESRRFALRQFRDIALESDILEDAKQESEILIRNFITTFVDDDTEIQIVFEEVDDPSAIVLPENCL